MYGVQITGRDNELWFYDNWSILNALSGTQRKIELVTFVFASRTTLPSLLDYMQLKLHL